MNTEPIKNYILSIKAYEAGDRPQSERLLAESIGIPELNDYMKANLGKLLDPNDAVLTLAIAQTKEKTHGNRRI